jgi:hypothetical protein
MAENSRRDDTIENPDVKHEASDVSVRGVLYFAGGLLVAAVIIHLLLWWMFDLFQARELAAKPPTRPWAESQQQRLPPEPRLEGLAPPFQVRTTAAGSGNHVAQPRLGRPGERHRAHTH